ncbi:MAG: peroxiredoxin-like family protein [Leptolyngbya sp.]|nr:peroxiredoxin-like family protein [Leptolyngbya sp.]
MDTDPRPPKDIYDCLQQIPRQRVSDGAMVPLLSGCEGATYTLVMVLPQLGDFDSLEYAWWVRRGWDDLAAKQVAVRAIGIGNRASGQAFCQFTGFPAHQLWVDPTAELHRQLDLYGGLEIAIPGLSPGQRAWVNLMLMCAGVASPGTLAEVFRGYRGDRNAPQLIGDDEVIQAPPLPPLRGRFFRWAGGDGFQRPFELATLRLRNMAEVLGKWRTYVPDATYLTQRGGTFVFDANAALVYTHRDRGILDFAEFKSDPLSFLSQLP